MIKCQDVDVDLYLVIIFSDCDSFDVHHALFSQGCCHLWWSQSLLPTSDNSFRSVKSLVTICLTIGCVEAFNLEDDFGLLPAVHFDKQVSV